MIPTPTESALLAAVDRNDAHSCDLAPRCPACKGCWACCPHNSSGITRRLSTARPKTTAAPTRRQRHRRPEESTP